MALDADALAAKFAANLRSKTDDKGQGSNDTQPNSASARKVESRPPPAVQKPNGRAQRKEKEDLPNAPEIEKSVLCAILYNPEKGFQIFQQHGRDGFFFGTAREWFKQMRTFYQDKGSLHPVVFMQHILDNPATFEPIGGYTYFGELQGQQHPVDVLPHYLEELRDKYVRRQIMVRSFSMASKAKNDDLTVLLADMSHSLDDLKTAAGGQNGATTFDLDDLLAFDCSHDPNCLVGRRFLVRGGSWMIAGPTGCGKSSLLIQLGVYWATGTPMFGMTPVRPLKMLMFQAEDDFGDVSEQTQGVFQGIQASEDLDLEKFNAQIRANLIIKQARGVSGDAFLSMVEQYAQILKPDLVGINPFFAYAGCDILDPSIGTFLRDKLFALGDKYHYCTLVMHHVSKPPRDGAGDAANTLYLGFGSSEVQNSFRAVSTISPCKSSPSTFRLDIGKRRDRSGAKDTDGEYTSVIYMEHSKEGICWNQVPEPESETGRADDILLQMSFDEPMKVTVIQAKMADEFGMARRTFYRHWDKLKKAGKVKEIKGENGKGWVSVSAASATGASADF